MASIEIIKASDGSGNANLATVQSSRSSGASTIIVDTVLGINPGGFAGSMGTPHTFVDPVTGEEITIISEATAVDFIGHVDGSNIEIDTIAAGQTDNGSSVGDIIIIRPTTQWGDNVAEVMEVAHNDDGTQKANSVDTAAIQNEAVTNAKLSTTAGQIGGVFQTYSAAPTGFSGSPTVTARWQQIGKRVTVMVDIDGTSNSTSFGFALPVASKQAIQMPGRVRDNSVYGTTSGLVAVAPNGSTASVFKDLSGASFTASGTKSLTGFTLTYEAA